MSDPLFHLSNPPGLYDPAPNGYSHIAAVKPGARLVFLSGQGGETADGRLAEGFEAQLTQAFENVRIAAASVGAGLRDIAKLTVLIVDHDENRLSSFGAKLNEFLGSRMKPACTLIPVPRLALDGMLVEIEATIALVG